MIEGCGGGHKDHSIQKWGESILARHVYSALVRPGINYGSTVGRAPSGTKCKEKHNRKIDGRMYRINRRLRVVAGAYKTTPAEVLHVETMVLPMQQHLYLSYFWPRLGLI